MQGIDKPNIIARDRIRIAEEGYIWSRPMEIFKQQRTGCCGVYFLQSSLCSVGRRKYPISALIQLTNTVPSAEGGCNPEDIVRAVRKLNLMASYRWNQSAEHIREYLRRGFCVGVNYYDPDLGDEHYASIVAINGKKILLGDPIVGGVREMNLQTFIDNWRETSLYPRKRLLREREAILIWE